MHVRDRAVFSEMCSSVLMLCSYLEAFRPQRLLTARFRSGAAFCIRVVMIPAAFNLRSLLPGSDNIPSPIFVKQVEISGSNGAIVNDFTKATRQKIAVAAKAV